MTRISDIHFEILADPESLARRVADWMLAAVTNKDGTFSVALSGGSTPQALYRHLAEPGYRDSFPWQRMHWFWGDERFVPHDDAQSNYRMVHEALLAHVPVPAANIHPIPTEGLDPEAAAAAYDRELRTFYGSDSFDPARPLFDINLMGLGEDGHTASLFPGSSVLGERERWVAAGPGPKQDMRITLTYPALESSAQMAFLVAGRAKREILARFRNGDDALPSVHVHPRGSLHVFADVAAAGVAGVE